MTDETEQSRSIIEDCQKLLFAHLEQRGPDAKTTITALLEILDGPRARQAGVGERGKHASDHD